MLWSDSTPNHAMSDPADRRHFALDTPHWEAFVAALDAPPRQHPRMQRLLQERQGSDPTPNRATIRKP